MSGMICPIEGCEAAATETVDNLPLCRPHAAALVLGARLTSKPMAVRSSDWRWMVGKEDLCPDT